MSTYTEDEAKTKWCFKVPRDPRDKGDIAPGMRCIGSACMAWQWDKNYGDGKKCGYCGLARQP